MIRVRKILYPTDFSTYSNLAYFHALSLAETYKATLAIVYVYSEGSKDSISGHREYWREQLEQVRPSNPAIAVNHVILDGNPADRIVGYSAEAGIDLIVIGTHGRTGVEKSAMGSVAEKVMRDAACSVLVVKLRRANSLPLS